MVARRNVAPFRKRLRVWSTGPLVRYAGAGCERRLDWRVKAVVSDDDGITGSAPLRRVLVAEDNFANQREPESGRRNAGEDRLRGGCRRERR